MITSASTDSRTFRSPGLPGLMLVLGLALTATVSLAADSSSELGFDRSLAAEKARAEVAGGFVPPEFSTAHVAAAVSANLRPDKVFAPRYDAREDGYVTPPRNQGACGACYAFGSAADVESRLLMMGEGEYDLSENSIKECHYQDSSCSGGNQYMTMSYLSDAGVVLESCDPYATSDVTCATGCAVQYQVLDWCAVSGNTVPATDVIKQYLVDHGPLHTTVYAGDGSDPAWESTFSSYDGTGALYYTGNHVPNHSVFIIGWDDSIAHGGGTGAWIVKNSWGTTWGGTCGYGTVEGYFYIAYGSASVGMYTSYVGALMAPNPDADLLLNDEGGCTSNFGGIGTSLWALARHDVPADTYVHRVEFWTTDVTDDVDVYVYDTFAMGSLGGQLAVSLNNSYTEPGYHYVELATPLAVTAGQDLYVAIKFQNQSYIYPMSVDGDGPVNSGYSWYSVDGASWYSLATNNADTNIRVRTCTDLVLSNEGYGDGDGEDTPDNGLVPRELQVRAAWPNPFNPTTNIEYNLPWNATVTVSISDLQGRRVRVLVDQPEVAGIHHVVWYGQDDNGRAVPSGVYFCQVTAGEQSRSQKLVLLK